MTAPVIDYGLWLTVGVLPTLSRVLHVLHMTPFKGCRPTCCSHDWNTYMQTIQTRCRRRSNVHSAQCCSNQRRISTSWPMT